MTELLFLFALMGAATVFYVNILLFSLDRSAYRRQFKKFSGAGSGESGSENGKTSERKQSGPAPKHRPEASSVKDYARASVTKTTLLGYDPLYASGYAPGVTESCSVRSNAGISF